MLFKNEEIFQNFNRFFIHFLVLDHLELLNFVDETALLCNDYHGILPIFTNHVVLTRFQDEIDTLKAYDKGANVFTVAN